MPWAIFAGVALPIIIALAWPLLFTDNVFNGDWMNHFWFMWHQSLALRENHAPSLFFSSDAGVLYPFFSFYGGTLYALVGLFSLALGNAPLQAYLITYLLGFLAAYGGWYWMARMAGLGRWLAHIPGVVFVTSPYYLTLIYGRGDWPEFIGVSAIPLLVASGLSVLRSEEVRLWPMLALAVSSVVFFGSHSLTILWGSTLLVVIGVLSVALVPEVRRKLSRRGVLKVTGLLVPALLVDAWFLLPALAYQANTAISGEYPFWREVLRRSTSYVSAGNLFTLSRASDTTPEQVFALSLPILVIAWVVVSIVLLAFKRRHRLWLPTLLILSVAVTLLIIAITHAGLLLALPRVYATMQFTYRLESYILLALAGAVLAVLAAVNGGGRLRGWVWTMVPVLLVSLVGAVQQVSASPYGGSRGTRLASFLGGPLPGLTLTDYVDVKQPAVNVQGLRKVTFPPGAVRNNRVSVTVHARPGELLSSNLEAGPEFVRVVGARMAGISAAGDTVLQVQAPSRSAGAGGSTPTETISVGPANNPPVVVGRWLAFLGILALFAQLVVLPLRRRTSRRA